MRSQHEDFVRALQGNPALLGEAARLCAEPPQRGPESSELAGRKATVPPFPEAAWRGIFADYREAMNGATEASTVFHFGVLFARCAVALGRKVYFSYGLRLYPNVYLVCFGPTGDRKTTATRKVSELGGCFKLIQGGGSGEGLADEFSSVQPGEGLLIHAEEFSQILRPGRWDGSTLKPFLTQCFDCPDRYEVKFRKSPISLEKPTPSLLAGTTSDWFWQDFSARDFQGGFGNRILFLTGERGPDIPLPAEPTLNSVSQQIEELADVTACQAQLEPEAGELWERFYSAWRAEESKRDPLLLAAVQRVPAYVLKLGMVYASAERTLPVITHDQLGAAILVGRYAERCVSELLSLQHAGTNPRKELERRVLAFIDAQPGRVTTRREIYRALARHYRDAEDFDRAFRSLERAGELFTKPAGRGSVWVGLEPLE
jgi:hypothetical protein